MKKNILIISLLILTFLFSGCAVKELEQKKNVIDPEDKNGITNVLIYTDLNLKKIETEKEENNNLIKKEYKVYSLMIKQALELVSKDAIAKGKRKFILINNDTNNLIGFPINTYYDLNKYCLNYNRDTNIEIKCSVFKEHVSGNMALFKFIILKEDNYKIASFDAVEVLEELKKETQPIN